MTFKARGLYASSSKEPGRFRLGPWLLLGVLLVLILVVTTVVSVLSNVTVHSSQRSDTFSGMETLELDNRTSGEIRLSGGDGDEMVVDRTVRGGPLREPDDTIDERGDTLRVDAHCGGFSPFGVCNIDYDVTVPEGTSLDLNTISGQVTVSNVHGDLGVDTTSGSVEVSDHVGDVTVQTVSGSTDLEGVEGTVQADSTSGDITASGQGEQLNASSTSGTLDLSGFDAEAVEADTTSGEISVGGAFDTAEIETVSGSVEVRTEEYFTLLSVESTSGSVTAQVPPQAYDLIWQTSSGSDDIGVDTASEADGRIDVSTVSGSLTVTAH